MDEREKISISEVMEEVQKEHSINSGGKRDIDDFDFKERENFKEHYKMLPDEEVAKIFSIDTKDVKKLASRLQVYKDPVFTQNAMVEAKKDIHLSMTKEDGSPATPGYLVKQMAKHVTEEEYREIMVHRQEGYEPKKLMEDLISLQMARVERGFGLEKDNAGMWMTVNSAVDTLQTMIIRYHEMEHGTKTTHILSFDEMVLRSQKHPSSQD
jgi:hypothetical protein